MSVCFTNPLLLMAGITAHKKRHNLPSDNPAGTSPLSIFPPICFYELLDFPKQEKEGDGFIQGSFIFRPGVMSETQAFIQCKHILVQGGLVYTFLRFFCQTLTPQGLLTSTSAHTHTQ